MSNKTPQQNPKRYKEASEPSPETSPDVPEEPKGDASSRQDASKEPAENEETRRVAKKLEERERGGS